MKKLLNYLAAFTRGLRKPRRPSRGKSRGTIPGQAPIRMDARPVLSAAGAAHIEPIEDES